MIKRQALKIGGKMFNALPGPGVAFIFKRVNAYRVNKIFARNIPMSLTFFVTDRCNAACDHCFFWKETDGLTRDEFSINQIDTLAAGLKGLQQVLLTGGEPFLREDLNQICEKFLHHGVKFITIPTNGILTRRIVALGTDVARHKNLETLRINISLDGLRDGHDAIRNVPGCYDQALETIHRLKGVSHIYPKLQVSVINTLSQKNISGLKTFIETVNKLNIPLIFSIVPRIEIGLVLVPDAESIIVRSPDDGPRRARRRWSGSGRGCTCSPSCFSPLLTFLSAVASVSLPLFLSRLVLGKTATPISYSSTTGRHDVIQQEGELPSSGHMAQICTWKNACECKNHEN